MSRAKYVFCKSREGRNNVGKCNFTSKVLQDEPIGWLFVSHPSRPHDPYWQGCRCQPVCFRLLLLSASAVLHSSSHHHPRRSGVSYIGSLSNWFLPHLRLLVCKQIQRKTGLGFPQVARRTKRAMKIVQESNVAHTTATTTEDPLNRNNESKERGQNKRRGCNNAANVTKRAKRTVCSLVQGQTKPKARAFCSTTHVSSGSHIQQSVTSPKKHAAFDRAGNHQAATRKRSSR